MKKYKTILTGMSLLLCAFCALACMYPNNPLGGGVNAGDGTELPGGSVPPENNFPNDYLGDVDPHHVPGDEWYNGLLDNDDGEGKIYPLPPSNGGGGGSTNVLIDPEGNVIPEPTPPPAKKIPADDELQKYLDELDRGNDPAAINPPGEPNRRRTDPAPGGGGGQTTVTNPDGTVERVTIGPSPMTDPDGSGGTTDITIVVGGDDVIQCVTIGPGRMTDPDSGSTTDTTDVYDQYGNLIRKQDIITDPDGNITNNNFIFNVIPGNNTTITEETDEEGNTTKNIVVTGPDGSTIRSETLGGTRQIAVNTWETISESYDADGTYRRTSTVKVYDDTGKLLTTTVTVTDANDSVLERRHTNYTEDDEGNRQGGTTIEDGDGNVIGTEEIEEEEVPLVQTEGIRTAVAEMTIPGGTRIVYTTMNGRVTTKIVIVDRVTDASGVITVTTTTKDRNGNILTVRVEELTPASSGGYSKKEYTKDDTGKIISPAVTGGSGVMVAENTWESVVNTYDDAGYRLHTITTVTESDDAGNVISQTVTTRDASTGDIVSVKGTTFVPTDTGEYIPSEEKTTDSEGNVLILFRSGGGWQQTGENTYAITKEVTYPNGATYKVYITKTIDGPHTILDISMPGEDGITRRTVEITTELGATIGEYMSQTEFDENGNITSSTITQFTIRGGILYSRKDTTGVVVPTGGSLSVEHIMNGDRSATYQIKKEYAGRSTVIRRYDENGNLISTGTEERNDDDELIHRSEIIVTPGPNGETINNIIKGELGSDGVFREEEIKEINLSTTTTTVTNADGSQTVTVSNSAGQILSVTTIRTVTNADGSVTTTHETVWYIDGTPADRLYPDRKNETSRTYTANGVTIREVNTETLEWVDNLFLCGVGAHTGNGYQKTNHVVTEKSYPGTTTEYPYVLTETKTEKQLLSTAGESLTGLVRVYYNAARKTIDDGVDRGKKKDDYDVEYEAPPAVSEENGMTVITFPDNSTTLISPAASLTRYTLERTGLWEIVSRPTTPRVRMDQVTGEDGKSNMRITYNNGQEVPFPVSPAVRMAKRSKASTEVAGETVPLRYDRAELWYKVLPQGTETDASVWHKIKEVSGDKLNRHVIDAPLKVFGSIDVPGLTAGDEVLFLLYLVDEDGEASGEALTEGAREPVVTIPAQKENLLDKVSSEQEYETTKHTTPYMMRVRYNGKRSLK